MHDECPLRRLKVSCESCLPSFDLRAGGEAMMRISEEEKEKKEEDVEKEKEKKENEKKTEAGKEFVRFVLPRVEDVPPFPETVPRDLFK